MKYLAIMFLLALCWLPRAWAEPQAPLRVAMLPYPDYAEYDADRRADGHAVRVIRRLLERAGYASEIRLLPVARVRLGLMSGELDLWLGLNNQVDLEAYTLQTQSSFGALPINLYYRPDEAAPSWPDSLRGRTLILITNYSYSLPVSRTLQDPRLALQTRTSSSHAGAIRMLLRGRGDYLLDYRGQVAAALDSLGMQALPHVVVDQPPMRLFVSRQRSDARGVLNRLDQAFDALVDEGVDMDVTRQ
ncbi:MAG: bifunctional lytic transglycosylase/amino acid ABC transporter substrate-binding protein [Pseudomonadales bacterium]|nr:bifunctional lytic transglycosylase/amino acid ABC transporter substrate-binding protein [Pseudomonadales bacterium]HCB41615.1 bifunctional lytic transglycosylase/amino acid ABC transporter substrate-binding protein [Pseudomonas sp.]|tara:strand:+ start:5923 stop:6660 length:738 start_codon:yes stop_codon:yes gene_type:complete